MQRSTLMLALARICAHWLDRHDIWLVRNQDQLTLYLIDSRKLDFPLKNLRLLQQSNSREESFWDRKSDHNSLRFLSTVNVDISYSRLDICRLLVPPHKRFCWNDINSFHFIFFHSFAFLLSHTMGRSIPHPFRLEPKMKLLIKRQSPQVQILTDKRSVEILLITWVPETL